MQQIPVLKILLLAMAGFFLPALLLKMWFTLCHPAFFPRFSLLQKGLLQQKKVAEYMALLIPQANG